MLVEYFHGYFFISVDTSVNGPKATVPCEENACNYVLMNYERDMKTTNTRIKKQRKQWRSSSCDFLTKTKSFINRLLLKKERTQSVLFRHVYLQLFTVQYCS